MMDVKKKSVVNCKALFKKKKLLMSTKPEQLKQICFSNVVEVSGTFPKLTIEVFHQDR